MVRFDDHMQSTIGQGKEVGFRWQKRATRKIEPCTCSYKEGDDYRKEYRRVATW